MEVIRFFGGAEAQIFLIFSHIFNLKCSRTFSNIIVSTGRTFVIFRYSHKLRDGPVDLVGEWKNFFF